MGRDLLQYKGILPIIIGLTLLSVIQGVAILMQAIKLAEVVTHLFEGEAFSEMTKGVMVFAGFFLLRYVSGHAKNKLVYHYAFTYGTNLRKQALTNLFRVGPRIAKQWGTGNLVTLLIEGISQFQQYLRIFLPKMTTMMVVPVFVGAYILYLDRTSAIIISVTVPILVVFMILLGLAAKKKADSQWQSYRLLSNHFVDSMRGLETLKYLGMSKRHTKNIKNVSDRYQKATMGTLRIAFLSSFAMDFFTMLSVATVAVFLGLRLIRGEIMLEPALAILILAPEFFLPIREIGSDYHVTLNGQEAGRKLMELSKEKVVEEDEENGTTTVAKHWTDSSQLVVSDLTVQHDEKSTYSLDGVSLLASGFQKIGIVGASGAGKSTIIDCLGGFTVPTKGRITLNDEEAVDHLQHDTWQKQICYIPQQPYLFHDTLRNNLTFYAPEASDAEVEWATRQAGLREFLDEWPNGLDEIIGEGGRNVSGGQAQRIALARAFLAKRPILLLDEPTAHLDVETEYELKQNMLPLFAKKFVFLATHRLHWMKEMDYIYYLEHGKVIEQGTHDDLLAKRGAYYEMVCLQEGGGNANENMDLAVR